MAAQQEGGRLRGLRFQRLLDGRHRVDDRRAVGGFQFAEQAGDLAARAAVEFGEGCAAFRGQCELGGAAVGFRRLSRDDLPPLQRLQGAAEITGIEAERADQIGRGAALPFGDLVDDAGFLQRPWTVEQFRFDDAEFAGIEPAEAAQRCDLAVEFAIRGI